MPSVSAPPSRGGGRHSRDTGLRRARGAEVDGTGQGFPPKPSAITLLLCRVRVQQIFDPPHYGKTIFPRRDARNPGAEPSAQPLFARSYATVFHLRAPLRSPLPSAERPHLAGGVIRRTQCLA